MSKLTALLTCCTALYVSGMGAPVVLAQEVVQALPNPAAADLANAMRRLSANPDSLDALVEAGEASLALENVDAALGFFARAQDIDPNDGRMLAGLGQVALRRGEAVTALQLFENADYAGEPMEPLAGERALAFDLVGNNARAQRLYRQAIDDDPDPETMRRLAISYAISGDQAAAEEVLLPLLQQNDLAAFRTRAFALAILGKETEAVTIAETMLPARLASRIAPYLRYMPRLTKAQQAAAADLGRFPSGSQIGRDDPSIAALATSQEGEPAAPRAATRGDERLIPSGPPLAQSSAPASADQPQSWASEPETVAAGEELPPLAEQDQPVTVAAVTEELPASTPAPDAQWEPSPQAAAVVARADADRQSVAQQLPAAEPEPEPDLASAFADFARSSPLPVAASANAVDITAIDIPRERPAPPPPPPPPAHPSRQWVQVATGQDTSAFRFDWRRIKREAAGLLDDAEAFVTPWGESNRLLTGPFATAREAQEFVSELGKAGVDSFRFTSDAGQEIKPL
ncbi:tetratricopeptide repeat protein [Aurantiacibacter suaedae]|uniref:tetratricopeptide repeat protein n=1 Tax=Aurantiacibacter suaedae TaxID=2545755 RepID=UPI001386F2D8|nr:tetratricopeptide repeat protein [Aurantiacibacter suaedae]